MTYCSPARFLSLYRNWIELYVAVLPTTTLAILPMYIKLLELIFVGWMMSINFDISMPICSVWSTGEIEILE